VIVRPRVVALALSETEPVPTALTAETRNEYEVPFDRSVAVVEVSVEVPSANVVHVVPLSDEYSIV
jgi:hypothetical protein